MNLEDLPDITQAKVIEPKERSENGDIVMMYRDGNCVVKVNNLCYRDKSSDQQKKEMLDGNYKLLQKDGYFANIK